MSNFFRWRSSKKHKEIPLGYCFDWVKNGSCYREKHSLHPCPYFHGTPPPAKATSTPPECVSSLPTPRMTFGKYKDIGIWEIPDKYLLWLLQEKIIANDEKLCTSLKMCGRLPKEHSQHLKVHSKQLNTPPVDRRCPPLLADAIIHICTYIPIKSLLPLRRLSKNWKKAVDFCIFEELCKVRFSLRLLSDGYYHDSGHMFFEPSLDSDCEIDINTCEDSLSAYCYTTSSRSKRMTIAKHNEGMYTLMTAGSPVIEWICSTTLSLDLEYGDHVDQYEAPNHPEYQLPATVKIYIDPEVKTYGIDSIEYWSTPEEPTRPSVLPARAVHLEVNELNNNAWKKIAKRENDWKFVFSVKKMSTETTSGDDVIPTQTVTYQCKIDKFVCSEKRLLKGLTILHPL